MSVFIWSMIGIAIWHFTIFLPDRFAGGIVGAFLAAWLGGLLAGFVFEGLTIPTHNPPGMVHVIWAVPGSIIGLAICWWIGVMNERRNPHLYPTPRASDSPQHEVQQPQTQEAT